MKELVRSEKSPQRLNTVYLCKGIAIFMVLIVHYAQSFRLPNWASLLPRFCQMGCQWFFLLSAFLLCVSHSQKRPPYLRFLLSRLQRLRVPYALAVLITVLLSHLSIGITGSNLIGGSLRFSDVVINLLLLNGLVPTAANNRVLRGGWFVGTIVLFYPVFPLLFKLSRKLSSKSKYGTLLFSLAICTFCFSANILIGELVSSTWLQNNSFGYFSLLNQLPALLFGFVLYDLYANGRLQKIKLPFLKGIPLLCLSVLLFFSSCPYAFVFEPAVSGAAFLYFTVGLLQREERLGGAETKNILAAVFLPLGKLSFPIYLTHTFVAYEGARLLHRLLGYTQLQIPELLLFVITLPIAAAAAFWVAKLFSLLVQAVEKKLKKAFAGRRPTNAL